MRTILLCLSFFGACTLEPGAPPVAQPELALPPPLVLSTDAIFVGDVAVITVSGAIPGRAVHLGGAVTDAGRPLCPPAIAPTCLDLPASAVYLGPADADADGVATWRVPVPDTVTVPLVYLQSLTTDGAGGWLRSPLVPVRLHRDERVTSIGASTAAYIGTSLHRRLNVVVGDPLTSHVRSSSRFTLRAGAGTLFQEAP